MTGDAMIGVGATDDRSVRLWLRYPDYSGELEARTRPEAEGGDGGEDGEDARTVRFDQRGSEETDWTMSVLVPDDVRSEDGGDVPDLRPGTRYRVRVATPEGAEVGEVRFETAPGSSSEPADRFTFAFMSCHQPFDEDGEVLPEAERMLELLGPTLEEYDPKYVLFIGDQMYSDQPPGKSLFEDEHFRTVARHGEESLLDCDEDEILHHFHRRYRKVWWNPAFSAIQHRRPTYWILDDHEIVDNWGATKEHSEPRWQRLGRAARRAFLHYQAGHALPVDSEPPDSFHQQFAWGDSATFITDMRSARAVEGTPWDRIFSEEQFDDIQRFLSSNADRSVVFFVLTVPILPLPKPVIQAAQLISDDDSDVDDRWEATSKVEDRDRFLRILHQHQKEHPEQRIVLLSGDVHLGCGLEIHWTDEDLPPFYQLVSSGVTNVLGLVDSALLIGISSLLPKMDLDGPRMEAEFFQGAEGENPFTGLNFGLVEVIFDREEPRLRFRILTSDGAEGETARVGFDSGEV